MNAARHDTTPDRIKVIYIVSSRLSGSTVLDLMLNRHPAIESVGEIVSLDRWVQHNWLCSCSQRIRGCEYWRSVLGNRLDEDGPSFIGHLGPARRRLGRFLWPARRNALAYGRQSESVFRAILDRTGKLVIVDSSKSLPRLKWLHQSGLFDLRVIHLVRNGKGHLYSQIRKRPPPPAHTLRRARPGSIRTIVRWRYYNAAIERALGKFPEEHAIRVRYEDLVRFPEREIRRICKMAELDFDPRMTAPSTTDIHNIAGNQWRFKKQERVALFLDERWRRELPHAANRWFECLAGNFNRALGYE